MVFFFQAEDGIRDTSVTGVQTCALPIYRGTTVSIYLPHAPLEERGTTMIAAPASGPSIARTILVVEDESDVRNIVRRSEERRVGKECRARWSPYQSKQTEHTWADQRTPR